MRVLWLLLLLVMLVPATPALAADAAVDPDDPEGIGNEMGYRMYGPTKKNRPLLLQNSRPFPVQVFDERRGVYVEIPAYSDREFGCSGKVRLLHVRYRDQFGESAPFQVRIGCGRELQFIAKKQVAAPVVAPAAELPAAQETAPAAAAGDPEIILPHDPAAPAQPAAAPAAEAAPAEAAPVEAAPPALAEPPPPFLSPVN